MATLANGSSHLSVRSRSFQNGQQQHQHFNQQQRWTEETSTIKSHECVQKRKYGRELGTMFSLLNGMDGGGLRWASVGRFYWNNFNETIWQFEEKEVAIWRKRSHNLKKRNWKFLYVSDCENDPPTEQSSHPWEEWHGSAPLLLRGDSSYRHNVRVCQIAHKSSNWSWTTNTFQSQRIGLSNDERSYKNN